MAANIYLIEGDLANDTSTKIVDEGSGSNHPVISSTEIGRVKLTLYNSNSSSDLTVTVSTNNSGTTRAFAGFPIASERGLQTPLWFSLENGGELYLKSSDPSGELHYSAEIEVRARDGS